MEEENNMLHIKEVWVEGKTVLMPSGILNLQVQNLDQAWKTWKNNLYVDIIVRVRLP